MKEQAGRRHASIAETSAAERRGPGKKGVGFRVIPSFPVLGTAYIYIYTQLTFLGLHHDCIRPCLATFYKQPGLFCGLS